MIIVVTICTTIFLFSSQPGNESEKIASNFFIRKLGHFSEYAILGTFTFIFINFITKNKKVFRTAFISFLFCVLYAISDEVHQTFVLGRIGTYKDVIIDSLGALTGIILYNSLFYNIFYKIKKQ